MSEKTANKKWPRTFSALMQSVGGGDVRRSKFLSRDAARDAARTAGDDSDLIVDDLRLVSGMLEVVDPSDGRAIDRLAKAEKYLGDVVERAMEAGDRGLEDAVEKLKGAVAKLRLEVNKEFNRRYSEDRRRESEAKRLEKVGRGLAGVAEKIARGL